MKRERQAWGSSRVYYSIQGLRQEHGMDFLVTLMRHSRTYDRKHLVVSPSRYMKLLEMVDMHTIQRFKQSRAAYERSLRPLEHFVCEHEISLAESV